MPIEIRTSEQVADDTYKAIQNFKVTINAIRYLCDQIESQERAALDHLQIIQQTDQHKDLKDLGTHLEKVRWHRRCMEIGSLFIATERTMDAAYKRMFP